MDGLVPFPVALAGLAAARATSTTRHAGIKEHHAIGRIERGNTEWIGGGRTHRSGPGTILVKQPGDVVRHVAHDGPTTYVVVKLPSGDVERACEARGAYVPPQLGADDPRSLPFHRLIDAVLGHADRLTLEVVSAEAIGALARLRTERTDHSRPVRRALEQLRSRPADGITLDELARHAELDKFHLCRAFRAQVGLPPHAYLTHLRVARAKELLRAGMRASDVAPLVGFCDQAQLTRHFRRLVGTTPGRYARTTVRDAPERPLSMGG